MNPIIEIKEKNGKQVASARELYDFLGIKSDFTTWCKRMFEYGFENNIDYTLIKIGERNAHNKIDYALTLDTAKEISMLQKTEKGKEARQYFIACEKKVKQIDFSNPQSVLKLAESWAREQQLRLEAEATIKKQAPKVLFTQAVEGSSSSCLVGELAKLISQNGVEIGQNRLFEWFRQNGYVGKFGERRNVANQQYIEQGLFELKKGVRSGNDGVLKTTTTTKVTGKGQVYFVNKFLKSELQTA